MSGVALVEFQGDGAPLTTVFGGLMLLWHSVCAGYAVFMEVRPPGAPVLQSYVMCRVFVSCLAGRGMCVDNKYRVAAGLDLTSLLLLYYDTLVLGNSLIC